MKRFIALTSLLMLCATACGKGSSSSDNADAIPSADTSVNTGTGSEMNSPAQPVPTPSPATPDVATPDATVPAADAAPVTLEVDATSKTDFAHLDLDTGKIVSASDASWDLAFKRTVIKMNTDVTAQSVSGTSFDAILKAPTDTYNPDAPIVGGLETDGLVFHAAPAWYSYDISVHVIYSNNLVYFVKANSGAEYKVSVNDYYNVDRLPAFIQLKWILVSSAPKAE